MISKHVSILLLTLVLTIIGANAQVMFPGACPSVCVVQPFDLSKYLGIWYEIEKYPAKFETDGKCIFADYSMNPNGTVKVRNARILNSTGTGTYDQIIGTARLADPTGQQAKLLVTFPTAPAQREAPYWVLETDYDYFSIVWSCSPIGSNNLQFLWYLSRTRNPDDGERANSRSLITGLGLDTTHLVPTDQARCTKPYAIIPAPE